MDEKELKALMTKLMDQHQEGLLENDDFIKAISAACFKVIEESLKTGDVDTLKKNVQTLTDELKTLRAGSLVDGNAKLLDPLYDGCWKSAEIAKDFGLYALASVLGSKKAADALKSKGYILQKDMGADDLTAGGLFVPQQLLDGLIMLIASYGKYRRNAQVTPMTADSATGMKLNSGLTVYCVQEGVVPTKSDAALSTVGLTAKEWSVYVAIDKTLNEDAAIMIGNLIGELIAMAFAEKEDLIGFMGTGISTHFGFKGIKGQFEALSSPAGVTTGTGVTWDSLILADFLAVQGNVHEKADDGVNLKWYCSRKFYYGAMMKIAFAAGGVYAQEMTLNQVSQKKYFLGDEVEFISSMPTATAETQLCCFYGNLKRGAMLGERRATTIEQSSEALFLERQIAVLGTERVAITVYGCGDDTTAGVIVALQTGTT